MRWVHYDEYCVMQDLVLKKLDMICRYFTLPFNLLQMPADGNRLMFFVYSVIILTMSL